MVPSWIPILCVPPLAWLLAVALLPFLYYVLRRIPRASGESRRRSTLDPLGLCALSDAGADESCDSDASAKEVNERRLSPECVCVGLVIAHPDDESMFFTPTLKAIAGASTRYDVSILCLSSGDAYGLGRCRRKELVRSCAFFGISEERVQVVDHPEIQDGFSTGGWASDVIVPILSIFVSKNNLSVLITFDKYGVSGHPNHTAVCQAAREYTTMVRQSLSNNITRNNLCPSAPCTLWELKSLQISLKFLGPMFATPLVGWHILAAWGGMQRGSTSRTFFLPSFLPCFAAMRLHQSQWVWFRWMFVLFSTYPYINQLKVWPPLGPSTAGTKLKAF